MWSDHVLNLRTLALESDAIHHPAGGWKWRVGGGGGGGGGEWRKRENLKNLLLLVKVMSSPNFGNSLWSREFL